MQLTLKTTTTVTLGALICYSVVGVAQPTIVSLDKVDQIREEALRPTVRKGLRTFSLVLTYVPSWHPEVRIVLSDAGGSTEVELIEAKNSTTSVIRQLKGTDGINVKSAAAMLMVRRTQLKVDASTVDNWTRGFESTFSASLDLLKPITTAELDGTLYYAEFSGAIQASLEISGSEIGNVQRSDPKLVQWMNQVLEEVRELARK